MPTTIPTPRWLERLATACLRADPMDARLGDLSEQHARRLERSVTPLSRVAASLHYAAAAANVVLFARLVDPGLRLAEGGTLGLLVLELKEKLMTTVRRLAVPAVLLACSAFLVHSAVAVWQDWQQAETLLQAQQRDKAAAVAQRVEAFLGDVQRQIGWVTAAQWERLPVEQQRFDYVRLLRQTPAITELTFVDSAGREQLEVSRLKMDVLGSAADRSADPAVVAARGNRGVHFGPVSLRKNSEPYLTMAVPHPAGRGVTLAAVNLKPVWDAVAQVRVGDTGYGYIVDGGGRLVAHPDSALVVRGTDMKGLAQVAAKGGDQPIVASNRAGEQVSSVQAPIVAPGWRVFVELPVAETRAALWMAVGRATGLLVLGLAAAWFAFSLGMRPAPPMRAAGA